MEAMGIGIESAGLAIVFAALGCVLTGHLKPYQHAGLIGAGNAVIVIGGVMIGPSPWLAINAALCAWHLHRWWKGGGGDDTKRRLRRAARRFQPVRRTAPAGAS